MHLDLTTRRFQLRRKPTSLARWRRFVQRYAAVSRAPDGMVEYRGATEMWIPERLRFLYYFTKDAMFRWWFHVFRGQAPLDIGIIEHGSTPTANSARLALHTAKSLNVPLVLLGDLDPGDLTAYAALVSGGLNLPERPRPPVNVLYGGLDDDFLQLARRYIGSRRFRSKCLLKMSADEREQLALIKRLSPPLESLCGPDSARLLEKGLKCEVEAILGPYICEGDYLAEVRTYLEVWLPARLGI